MSGPRSRPGWLRRFCTDTGAVAAVEMALVLPAIGFIAINVVDFATYLYSKMQVDIAAQQAVGVVRAKCGGADLSNATCGTTYKTAMTDAAQQTSLGTAVTVGSPTEDYYCADPTTGTLVVVGSKPKTCSGTVKGSKSAPGTYLGATVSYKYSPIFPRVSVASYLGSSIQSTAWIRLK